MILPNTPFSREIGKKTKPPILPISPFWGLENRSITKEKLGGGLRGSSGGRTVDSEYAGGKMERCCGVGALQASRDELDANGSIGNGSARGRSEAKRNSNRKKQRKKSHHHVNGRKISVFFRFFALQGSF